MRRAVFVVMLTLVGCSDDPSLRVEVHHAQPPDRTVVTVYESSTVTCDQIAFGDLDEGQLAALTVATLELTDAGSTGSLDGLSRTARKLIVARAYKDDELREAGCVQHDEVIDADVAEVTTVPIAFVATSRTPSSLDLVVTDRTGIAIANRAVSYRMFGPAGSKPTDTGVTETSDGSWQPAAPSCTAADGTLALHPVTPDTVGGYAASVRVAWADRAGQVISGLSNAVFELEPLALPAGAVRPCAVSIKGATKRIVCITKPTPIKAVARAYQVTSAGGVGMIAATADVEDVPTQSIAVVSVPSGADLEVYALDSSGALKALFGAAPAAPTTNCPDCTVAGGGVKDVLVAPACGSDPVRLLLNVKTATGDSVRVMPPRGGMTQLLGMGTANATITFNNSGCVTTTSGAGNESRQLTVIDIKPVTGAAVTQGFYNCSATTACKRVRLPVPTAATAFTKTSPPYLIGATNDPSGVVLATWALVPDPDSNDMSDQLVERAPRVPSVTIPDRIAVGSFDTDAGSDLIWNLSLRSNASSTFEVAYAKVIPGGTLQALSDDLDFSTYDLLATDVTGDDHDDIIIVTKGIAALGGIDGLVVLPTHAAAPSTAIPDDPPCAP